MKRGYLGSFLLYVNYDGKTLLALGECKKLVHSSAFSLGIIGGNSTIPTSV